MKIQLIEKTYYDILKEQADLHSDKVALVKGMTSFTYGELIHKINQIASFLISKGLKKNEKVVLWSGADPMWLCAYFGIIRAGGVAVILNANLTVKDAAPLVEFADTSYVLYGETHDTKGSNEENTLLSALLGISSDKIYSIIDTDYDSVKYVGDDVLNQARIEAKEDAYIIYTSGTTSFPKAVTSSQYGNINLVMHIVNAIAQGRGDKAVLGVPLFHAYGIMVSWVYLSTGGTIYIPERVKAEDVGTVVYENAITDIWSVAVVYQGIIDDKDLCAKVASTVHFCTIAGSYTTPVQFMRYEAGLYNAKFVNMYGMTETCAAYVMTRPEDNVEVRYNTLGRVVDDVELQIWDEEKGFLQPGEVGEIITRGFHLKNSYYKLPADKQAVDSDGWLHSGDLGVLDEGGNLRIVGRIKDLIIKGGENITPGEIEAEIMNLDCIKNCRVFGYHDRVYGENIGACVVLNEGEAFEEAAVKKIIKKKLGSYKTPVYFFVYEDFPLNANGKIDQNRLHNDMLTRKCKYELEKKLGTGVVISDSTIAANSYTYAPTASWMEEFANAFGFSKGKALKVRLAVEEMFYICNRNSSENNSSIELKLICTDHMMRVAFSSESLKYSYEHTEKDSLSELLVFKMVDDFQTFETKNGQFYVQLDFMYETDFDIMEFLMHHEKVQ